MQDFGAFENSPPRHGDLAIMPRELGVPIPLVLPLSLDEIIKVEKSRFGLRNTTPEKLPEELREGVNGDYVVISNLEKFLKSKEADPFHRGADAKYFNEILVTALIEQGRLDLLDGLDQLPARYQQALTTYFKEALLIRMNNIFHEGNENMSLDEYLTNYVSQYSPAYLLVQDNKDYSPSSYDHDRYYGFGKHGKNIIKPDSFISSCQFVDEDVQVLRDRYKPYLNLPVNTYVRVGNKQVHLGDLPDDDIIQLTQQKVLGMIRSKIA